MTNHRCSAQHKHPTLTSQQSLYFLILLTINAYVHLYLGNFFFQPIRENFPCFLYHFKRTWICSECLIPTHTTILCFTFIDFQLISDSIINYLFRMLNWNKNPSQLWQVARSRPLLCWKKALLMIQRKQPVPQSGEILRAFRLEEEDWIKREMY